MAGYDFDLVCLGSGPAGQRGAVQAAKLGKRAAIVEKQRVAGGVCVETGTIPSKTFREAVLSYAAANTAARVRRAAARGRDPRPNSSSPGSNDVIRREGLVVEDQLRRNGVDLIPRRGVLSRSAHRARAGGRQRPADQRRADPVAVGTTPGLAEATGVARRRGHHQRPDHGSAAPAAHDGRGGGGHHRDRVRVDVRGAGGGGHRRRPARATARVPRPRDRR